MFLSIDASSGLPIYRQLMEQVRRMVAAHTLKVGERLPSVRDLSATLHINPLTVAKAYQELERAGDVEMRRGLGVFVARTQPIPLGPTRAAARTRAVHPTAERLVLEAMQAGLSARELTETVNEIWSQVQPATAKGRR
jgi:GntR family transcriptional regulator